MEFTRESVFISAVRTFFKVFAAILGIGTALFIVLLGFASTTSKVKPSEKSELTLSPDANWHQELLPQTAPVILRINVTGVVGMGDLKTEKFKQMLINSRGGVLSEDRVKGILLYVNTPGGTAIDSSGIYTLLEKYKEKYKVPVFAFVDGLCASGGMYICSAADRIFATADSAIGSVGVRFGPVFNVSEAMQKVGIASTTFTEGKGKDALNPFRPAKPGEGDALQAVLAGDYEQFIAAVTKGRPRLDREKLVDEYGAKTFIAKTARDYGYIDEAAASYDEALTALVAQAGIDEKAQYQVLQIEPSRSTLRDLATSNNTLLKGKLKHIFPTGTYTDTEMSGQPLYLYQP